MEYNNPWKLIKAGFWIGWGFIIPSLIVYFLGTLLVYKGMASLWEYDYSDTEIIMNTDEESGTSSNYDPESFMRDRDRTNQITINDYNDTKNGNQLLILGTITNTGDKSANSIQLEAELFDSDGKYVYECSEYISRKLMPGDKENFQIKCGCGNNPVPEYESVKVRVVGASNY